METNATKMGQAMRGGIRNAFRPSDLSIRSRLIACFVLIVVLMIAADAVAGWQYWQIEASAQRVSKTDQISDAVVRVHLDVDSFRDSTTALADSHDTRQFSGEAASIRQTFLQHVDHAEQMLRANPDIEEDTRISSALESLRLTLLSQLDTAVQLATVGEWNAVQFRLANQIPALIEFSSSLVQRVDQQALEKRNEASENAQKARQRLFIIVPVAALLTLLAAAALGWYLTQTVTGPLSLLTASAEALARGDFQHKVQLRGNNELAVLGNAFNDAAQQLQKLYEDLRLSERELRGAINTVPAHVWSASPDGTVDFVNERLLEFAGLSSDDLLGWKWESVIHSDDRARFIRDWCAAVEDGHPIENEIRVRRADGLYRWFLVRSVPLRDDAGKVVKWYGSSIEIEDLKRAEEERERLRLLQSDLAHIQRVTTMGEFAASIAHEIRQPITAASINANACLRWLWREQPNIEKAHESASRIIQNVTLASDIISRIRVLYKKGEQLRECVDVNEVIGEIISLARSEARRHAISIHTDLAPELPHVMADRVQLQQVIMNLVRNGIDAICEADMAGDLTIRSQRSSVDQLLISIRDTGIGLPPERADKIFEAFFTTKSQGTGMGLSISRSIIESHGGRLWATGNPDRGTTFQFTLPIEPAASTVVA
ncbi:sensor histidine kinase [Acidicapsa acidisoli]|uniref:sensor histidine kinase n=1 Tax=Acidicapsa acidisoli TaxID=1615681 RepID=UPI0021E0F0CD|nr:ATP-binding protein [Acidicapsa acidisoli]